MLFGEMMQKCLEVVVVVYLKYREHLSTVFICQHLPISFLLEKCYRAYEIFLLLEMPPLAYVDLHYVADYANALESGEDRTC